MRSALPLVAAVLVWAGCGGHAPSPYVLSSPRDIGDGLAVGTPDGAGLDSDLLAEAVARIADDRFGEVHSLLIYKDGKLVVEEYFPGHTYAWDAPGFRGAWIDWNEHEPHNIHSVGKSITSASIGIAIDRGYIESVDESIFEHLPDHRHLMSDGRDAITIEHLLTMTSGLAWDEWGTPYSDPENDVIRLWLGCEAPVTCVLEAPLESEPGTEFTYSGGNMVVLGEIVRNATGMDIEEFSARHLFEPLGIDPPEWRRFDTGVIDASADQYLTPRDLIKFGATYLDRGIWQGRRILSEAWVDKSSTPYRGNVWLNSGFRPMPPGDGTRGRRGYAYAWWTHEYRDSGSELAGYFALGFGGQKVYVFPGRSAVVVFTAGNYGSADTTNEILTEFVLAAMR